MSTVSASASWFRRYTLLRTHISSASTQRETQTPLAMNVWATATCRSSSRTMRRTSTFVSTARMLPANVVLDPPLQLFERLRLRRRGEERLVNILERIRSALPRGGFVEFSGAQGVAHVESITSRYNPPMHPLLLILLLFATPIQV